MKILRDSIGKGGGILHIQNSPLLFLNFHRDGPQEFPIYTNVNLGDFDGSSAGQYDTHRNSVMAQNPSKMTKANFLELFTGVPYVLYASP